ncbi:MAG: TetR/AcrR family transcriptional regulator [Rhodomicrobium sp.]|nr:TetR/AcrR family transcriptional regulator [Rhodomicrobium sp.]
MPDTLRGDGPFIRLPDASSNHEKFTMHGTPFADPTSGKVKSMDVMKHERHRSQDEACLAAMSSQEAIRMPGQRDPERTRRAILEAATAEFVSKGFAGGSVNEIADRANVNKRMLYHYFGKKEDLYIAVLEHVYTALRNAQAELKLHNAAPAAAIEELIRFTWQYYLDNPDFLSLMILEVLFKGDYVLQSKKFMEANAPLLENLQDILERGQREGVFKKDVDPLHVYLTIAALGTHFVVARGTLSNLMGRDFNHPDELEFRVRHIVEVVLSYLRA